MKNYTISNSAQTWVLFAVT